MEKKWRRLEEEGEQAETYRSLAAYGVPLYQVASFKYLGRVIAEEDNNWPAVVHNLRRDRQKWYRLTHILSREGEDA